MELAPLRDPAAKPRAAPTGAAASAAAAAAAAAGRSAPAPRRSAALTPPSSSLPRALPPSFLRPCDRGRPLGRARPRSPPPPSLSPRASAAARHDPLLATALAHPRLGTLPRLARAARSRGYTHPAQACEPPLQSPRAGTRPTHAGTLARTGTRGLLTFAFSRKRPPDGCGPGASRAPRTAGLKDARAHIPTPTLPDPLGLLDAHPSSEVAHSHSHLTLARSQLRTFSHVQALTALYLAHPRPTLGVLPPASLRGARARAPRPHFGQRRPAHSAPPLFLSPQQYTHNTPRAKRSGLYAPTTCNGPG